jgi:hypothetical protein
MIELSNCATDYSQHLFVRPEYVTGFFFTEAPKLISAWAQAETARQLQKIAKTLIAFVRHGHGEDTIDESGDYSEDDQREWKKRKRQIAKEKEN